MQSTQLALSEIPLDFNSRERQKKHYKLPEGYRWAGEEAIQRHLSSILSASQDPTITTKPRNKEAFESAAITAIIETQSGDLAACLFLFDHQGKQPLGLPQFEVGGARTVAEHTGKGLNNILSSSMRKYIQEHAIPTYALSYTTSIHNKRRNNNRSVYPFIQLQHSSQMLYNQLIPKRNDSYALGLSPAASIPSSQEHA